QPIGHWKGIVENGMVGEVPHGKTIEPLERAEECISIFVVGYFDLPGKHSLCGVCPSQSQSQPPSDALEISQYLPGVRKPMAMEKTPYEPPLFTMRQERKAIPSGQLDSPIAVRLNYCKTRLVLHWHPMGNTGRAMTCSA